MDYERKMAGLLRQLGYSQKQTIDTIRKEQDEIYFDTIRWGVIDRDRLNWYLDFRKKEWLS